MNVILAGYNVDSEVLEDIRKSNPDLDNVSHEKVMNLSALIQTALEMLTAG